MKILLIVLFINSAFAQHTFRIINRCPFTVWPGILGNAGKPFLLNGGFQLLKGQSRSVTAPNGWGGRIWPRRSCEPGWCASGDCGRKIECRGAGGVPPVTLAEFQLDGFGGKDYYDISLVDGYNLPMAIRPIAGTFRKTTFTKYDCTNAGCNKDLNAICPPELTVWYYQWKIACKSACERFQTDQYCCRGAFNTPQTCKSSAWPRNYPAIFKQACPDAYSYAYDDETSTFTCRGNPRTGYEIIFCP